MPDLKKLINILRCPYCHSLLNLTSDKKLDCYKCNEKFSIANDVPIMISSGKLAELEMKIREWHKSEYLPSLLSYGMIQLIKSPAPFKWFKRKKILDGVLRELNNDGFYVDLGGIGELSHPAVYCANLELSSSTQLVCDGLNLPFDDGAVDGIFILLVLEHVPEPFAIAKEIKRVLKKDGFVLATIPFLQVLHENPKDYYRFTPDGIRKVFDGFHEERLDIASGPTGSLIWILKEYGALLFPFSNNRLIYTSIREILGWILYPLILLDYYLLKKKNAAKMSSYFYYMGRK